MLKSSNTKMTKWTLAGPLNINWFSSSQHVQRIILWISNEICRQLPLFQLKNRTPNTLYKCMMNPSRYTNLWTTQKGQQKKVTDTKPRGNKVTCRRNLSFTSQLTTKTSPKQGNLMNGNCSSDCTVIYQAEIQKRFTGNTLGTFSAPNSFLATPLGHHKVEWHMTYSSDVCMSCCVIRYGTDDYAQNPIRMSLLGALQHT